MIEVKWADSEKTIILMDYFSPIASWEEYQAANKEAYEMIQSQKQLVHLIHNPGSSQMPSGNAIGEIRRAIATLPNNTGIVIMILSNIFAQRILEVTLQIYMRRKNFYFLSNVEEAFAKIKAETASKV